MNLPDDIRNQLRDKVWEIADQIDWQSLGLTEKTRHYENWTKDPEIGGVIGRFMDVRQVRVYLKDCFLKEYARARQSDALLPFRLLALPPDAPIEKQFIKPHGRRLSDGRVLCWGRAADWKAIVMAVYERSFHVDGAIPFAAVLLKADGKYADPSARAIVEDAAQRLGIERLVWQS